MKKIIAFGLLNISSNIIIGFKIISVSSSTMIVDTNISMFLDIYFYLSVIISFISFIVILREGIKK